MTPADWASIGSAIFAGISALVAAAAIYLPARSQASQKLLDQAQFSLERAYEALSRSGQEISPPAPDRLNWLTAARHLQRYKALKLKLTETTHQVICEEQEEYWRHRIYLCLQSPNVLQPTYFRGDNPPNGRQPIDKASALVVYAFSKWPDGRIDPLDSVDQRELIETGRALEGNPGLRVYVEGGADARPVGQGDANCCAV